MESVAARVRSLPSSHQIARDWSDALQQVYPDWEPASVRAMALSALEAFYRYLDGCDSAGRWELQAFLDHKAAAQIPSLKNVAHTFITLRTAFRQALADYDALTQSVVMERLDAWSNAVVARYDSVWMDRARWREREMARELAELAFLNRCATMLNASLDLVSAFNATAALASELTRAEVSIVYQHEDGYLKPKAVTGIAPAACKPIQMTMPQLAGLLIVDDQRRDIEIEVIRQHWGLPQAQAIAYTPLRSDKEIIGSLLTAHFQPQRFTSHQIRLRQAFASHAGQAICNAYLFECLSQLTLAQERRRIACEMHDTMLQTLVSLNINLQVALSQAEQRNWEKVAALLQEGRRLGKLAVQEGRDTLHSLRDEGCYCEELLDALQPELDLFTERSGIRPTLQIVNLAQVPCNVTHQLCRLVGEALSNVHRHAAATEVRIAIEADDRELRLQIRDNGIGFDPQAVNPRASFGLIGMRERARLINARLDIESAPGQGTSVALGVPLAAQPGVRLQAFTDR